MAMPQPAPRHFYLKEWMAEGIRILRKETPSGALDPATLAALDQCLQRIPAEGGMGIVPPNSQWPVLARALRVFAEELLPYVDPQRVDMKLFPETLRRVEERLRAPRSQ